MTQTPDAPLPDPSAVLATVGWRATGPYTRVTGGWDTLLWRFTGEDGRDHALRLYRPNADVATAAAVREELAMRAARAGGLPVPDVQATGTFEGAPFFVLEWMGGVTAVDMALKAPWRMARVARALGAAQARFHAIPPPAGLPERGTAWIEATIAHPGLRAALLRESRADTFCHLDFHPLNVLGQGTTVTAILDFAAAGVSDRRADLAFTNTALLDIPAPPGPTRPVMQLLRRVYNKNWRKGYASVAGSFPLTPLFEALGIYYYFGEVSRAVEEKRGWVQARELDALRKKVSERLRAAGLDD